MQFPGELARQAFDSGCLVRDIRSISHQLDSDGLRSSAPVELNKDLGKLGKTKKIWAQLFENVHYFEHAKFYVVRVTDRSELPETLQTQAGFSALARTQSGKWQMIEAVGHVS